jgi:hypothetical protein
MVTSVFCESKCVTTSALCPHCFKTAMGIDNTIKFFGLRNMVDGVTRVQSWCKDCRNDSPKEVRK